MNSIQIDDQVLAELEKRATGFHVTPNDVLRRVLNLTATAVAQSTRAVARLPQPVANGAVDSSIIEFIRSDRFQRHRQAIDRFLTILAWLHVAHPKQFTDAALSFRRGKRLYFAKSQQEIERSGDGITAKPISQSPFWVLTTLDNKSKRIVVEDVLHALGYSRGDINLVVAELPDSDIRRRHGTVGRLSLEDVIA